jgi:hypothetical protein
MLWWPMRGDAVSGREQTSAGVRWDVVDSVVDSAVDGAEKPTRLGPGPCGGGDDARPRSDTVAPVTTARVSRALDRLEVRHICGGDGAMFGMWERHAMLFALEGPRDEILVIRARPHSTVPADWSERAHLVVNEWNHTRRFCKAYVGDPIESGRLPIYAEVQVPLMAGVHDALLTEVLDCATTESECFVEWLHDEGALF